MGSERGPPIPALLLLNLMHSWENRSFKESRHQMEGFIPFPSHTHPFFIPVPNRPSHLPLTSHYPLSLHSTSTPFFSPSHTLTPSLHLHFTFLPFLISPSFLPFLSPSSHVIQFSLSTRPSLLAAIHPVLHPHALQGSVAVIMKPIVNRY